LRGVRTGEHIHAASALEVATSHPLFECWADLGD
jgi:hypothetical protein